MLKIYEHFLQTNGERLTNYSRSVRNPNHKLNDANLISQLLTGFMSSKIIRDRATMSMVSSSYLPKKRVQNSK